MISRLLDHAIRCPRGLARIDNERPYRVARVKAQPSRPDRFSISENPCLETNDRSGFDSDFLNHRAAVLLPKDVGMSVATLDDDRIPAHRPGWDRVRLSPFVCR